MSEPGKSSGDELAEHAAHSAVHHLEDALIEAGQQGIFPALLVGSVMKAVRLIGQGKKLGLLDD